jgi:hypothetical protein
MRTAAATADKDDASSASLPVKRRLKGVLASLSGMPLDVLVEVRRTRRLPK